MNLSEIKQKIRKDFTFRKIEGMEPLDSRNSTHMTASKLSTLSICPKKYEIQYVLGVRVPDSPKQRLGTDVHAILQLNDQSMIDGKGPMPVEEAMQAFIELWTDSQPEVVYDVDDECSPTDYMVDGVNLIKAYFKERVPKISPVATEIKFDVHLPEYGVHLAGFMDSIDSGVINDRKVSSKSFTQDEVDLLPQLTVYSLAYRKIYGKLEEGVGIEHLFRSSAKEPVRRAANHKTHYLSSRRTADDHLRLLFRAQKAMALIKTGLFFPVDNQQVCGWCSFKEICKKECCVSKAPKFVE